MKSLTLSKGGMVMYKRNFLFVLSIVSCLIFISPAFAQDTVVVPNSNADLGANGSFKPPFNCAGFGADASIRYQQIYLASQIGQAGMIDKISFRLNSVFEFSGDNGFDAQYPNAVVQLSTTSKVPVDAEGDPLSNNFDENIGPDVKTVFSGNLRLSAPNCFRDIPTIGIPCPFDVMIPLQEMFMYDPADGNLLLDIRLPQCPELEEIVTFDLETFNVGNTDEIISLVFLQDVNSPTGSGPQGNGLVTEFRFFVPRSIPTLSEWGLVATAAVLGIIGIIAVRRRQAAA